MKSNQTIEKIRKVREEISRVCNYDPRKLVDYYMERQKERESNTKEMQLPKGVSSTS